MPLLGWGQATPHCLQSVRHKGASFASLPGQPQMTETEALGKSFMLCQELSVTSSRGIKMQERGRKLWQGMF